MDHSRNQIGIEFHASRKHGSSTVLLPIMAAVFIAFIVIGLAIPVLPLHVHQGLGFGTFVVGLVTGSQFAAAILSRVWAGRDADIRGAKHAVIAGLVIAALAGLLYFLSLSFITTPRSRRSFCSSAGACSGSAKVSSSPERRAGG